MLLFLKKCCKLLRITEGQIEKGKQTIKKPKPRHVILNISIPKGVFLREIWPRESFWKVWCPQQLWKLSPLSEVLTIPGKTLLGKCCWKVSALKQLCLGRTRAHPVWVWALHFPVGWWGQRYQSLHLSQCGPVCACMHNREMGWKNPNNLSRINHEKYFRGGEWKKIIFGDTFLPHFLIPPVFWYPGRNYSEGK